MTSRKYEWTSRLSDTDPLLPQMVEWDDYVPRVRCGSIRQIAQNHIDTMVGQGFHHLYAVTYIENAILDLLHGAMLPRPTGSYSLMLRLYYVDLSRAARLRFYLRLNRGGSVHTDAEITRVEALLAAENGG